jgi:hypothetical protein
MVDLGGIGNARLARKTKVPDARAAPGRRPAWPEPLPALQYRESSPGYPEPQAASAGSKLDKWMRTTCAGQSKGAGTA